MSTSAVLLAWSFQPAVTLGLLITAFLYVRGIRYSRRTGIGRRLAWWQIASFLSGLAIVFIALDSPVDTLSDQWFWMHMIQHELLTLLAAPLLLIGAPGWPMWRAFPASSRRASLGWVLRQRWPRRLWHAISSVILHPWVAWSIYVGMFTVWHIPALYDLALQVEPVHILEHLLFLGTALLFWAQVIPSHPMQPRLSPPMRVVYLGAAGMHSSLMGSLLMYSTGPFYPYYVAVASKAGAMSALVDQHLGGAAMDVPGTIIFFVAISVLLALWLQDDERAGAAQTSLHAVRH